MRWRTAVLAAVLCTSAALRLVGIGHGLRRGDPMPDEYDNVVGPVMQMWETRSADPQVHSGYPGFFNYLAFLPMGLGRQLGGEAGACLAGRVMVAAFGTLSVLLLYLVVRRDWGEPAALFGAALLGLSRSEVSEGHFISPDVLLVTALLGLLLVLRARPDSLWAGVVAGLATAVKYSGVLLLPAVIAEIAARRRLRPRVLALLPVFALTFVAAAPFALRWDRSQSQGFADILVYYFGGLGGGRAPATMGRALAETGGWIWINLGPPGVALIGAAAWARPRLALAGPAAVLAASLAALSLASQVYPRHVLLPSAAATVLAAAGFAWLARRLSPAAALAAATAVLALPAVRAVAVTAGYARPTERDRAASWMEAQARPLRVATPLPHFRSAPPVEVRAGLPLRGLDAEALAHYDLLLLPAGSAPPDAALREVARFEEAGNPAGALLLLRAAVPADDVAWPPPSAASGTAPAAESAFDGLLETVWTAPPGAGWIEARWARPAPLHVVEVVSAPGEGLWPQRLALLSRGGGGEWQPMEAIALRPQRARLQRRPHGQVYLLPGAPVTDGLRVERRAGGGWGVAEMRLFSRRR